MLREVLLALLGGFGQSLQLFCYTLLGALPLGLVIAFGSMTRWRPLQKAVRGLVWVVRGTPLMLQLIVIYYGPGLLIRDGNLWGGGGGHGLYHQLRLLLLRDLSGRHRERPPGTTGGGPGPGHDPQPDLFPGPAQAGL